MTSLGGLSSGRGQCGEASSIIASASRHSSESEAITIATSWSGSGAGKLDARGSHRASAARCRSPPAGIRSACCRPCRWRPQAQARAAAAASPRKATGTADGKQSTSAWIARPACLSPEQLRDQRQVEALAGLRRAVRNLATQLGRAGDAGPRRRRPVCVKLRQADAVGAFGARRVETARDASQTPMRQPPSSAASPARVEQQFDLREDVGDAIENAMTRFCAACAASADQASVTSRAPTQSRSTRGGIAPAAPSAPAGRRDSGCAATCRVRPRCRRSPGSCRAPSAR